MPNIQQINQVLAQPIEQSPVLSELKEHAKNKGISFDLVTASIKNAVILAPQQTKNALEQCSMESYLRVVKDSITIGLLPNTATQDCFIVPFRGEATFQMGYQGYMRLAGQAGVDIISGAIHQNDQAVYKPTDLHNPLEIQSPIINRGNVVAYYAIATHGDRRFVEIMETSEIDKIKQSARTKYIWDAHYGEMARKTVVRRLCKQIRHIFQDNRTQELLAMADKNDNQGFGNEPQKAYVKETKPEPVQVANKTADVPEKNMDETKAKTTAPKKATPTKDYTELQRVLELANIQIQKKLEQMGLKSLNEIADSTYDKWMGIAIERAGDKYTPPSDTPEPVQTAPVIDVIPENPQTPEQQAIKDQADMYEPTDEIEKDIKEMNNV